MKKLINKMKLTSNLLKINNYLEIDKKIAIINKEDKSYLFIYNNSINKNSKVFEFCDKTLKTDVMVSIENFDSFIKLLELSENFDIYLDDKDNFTIKTESSKMSFATSHISRKNNSDFYNIFDNEVNILEKNIGNEKIQILDLIDILTKAIKICSNDLSKPKMSKIFVESNDNNLKIIATDAFILYKKELNLNLFQKGEFLFDKIEIENFIKFLKKQDKKINVKIDIKDNILYFKVNNENYYFKSVGSNYISYQVILPTNSELKNDYKSCSFDKKYFNKVLKKAKITISKDAPIMITNFKNETLKTNDEKSNQTIQLKPIKNEIIFNDDIGLSLKYVELILKLIKSKEIDIEIKDNENVILVNDEFIIMSMDLS